MAPIAQAQMGIDASAPAAAGILPPNVAEVPGIRFNPGSAWAAAGRAIAGAHPAYSAASQACVPAAQGAAKQQFGSQGNPAATWPNPWYILEKLYAFPLGLC